MSDDITESLKGVRLISGRTGSGISSPLAAEWNSIQYKYKGRVISFMEEPVSVDISTNEKGGLNE
ncbi:MULTISPECIES: hypothetical protein [unclassified Vibrio]|uniref:hypothetical protein n=1 Tax=unclassified Vibrio TaxID=2614977 RepID=UPI000B8E542F|nr:MULTISPECIES: hypothetical protein [unclassified Vibrio]NAW91689.1 hypothetical protein [Vibrio sp. V24_P1S3T111]OXX19133.1 hypothetical protein B9J86_16135 [Vibrio sp. V06_P1A73T115]OXX20473.1 hypothetical protein B9J88_13820 [Vibrio sp. V05_P4A8T149]OXX36293.1 hypothetical protein B9J81_06365 [Vibrio sp. V04_P4A5T148]OXX55112.1 hypothetical protein B9J91_10175 [Vibrio sp. V18_P1S4T112]